MSSVAASGSEARVAAGFNLLHQGRFSEALRASDDLLAIHPLDPRVIGLAVEVRLAGDDAEAALSLIDAALVGGAAPLALLPRRAHVLMALMRREDAKRVAAEIVELSDGDARTFWTAGRILSRCDDPAGAAKQFEAALQAGCDDPELLYDLAAAQFFLGRFEEAERNLDSLLERVPIAGDAMYLRSTLRAQTSQRNHVAQLEQRLREGLPGPVDAAGCCYALAKELEDLGQWERSFSVLSRGAALKRSTLRYDAAGERLGIDAIAATYTAEVVADSPEGEGDGPIFVVGLPRTGTTLVERILSRHHDAASVGELPYFGGALATAAGRLVREGQAHDMLAASLQIDFAALGRAYLEGARQAAGSPASRRLVDKMPINYMYCGLIRKALPNARIVHVTRDPMDACYAIYKTLFQNAYHFSYDLHELAAYYISYHRLMRHWHTVMPEGVLEVRYEDLVYDPETQARRMLEWCGLQWTPEVLAVERDGRPSTTASAAQVRRPMHAGSIGKWRKVEHGLEPIMRALREAHIIEG